MTKTLLLVLVLLCGVVLVYGNLSDEAPAPVVSGYGYSVSVSPNAEFDDFIDCSISVFALEGEKAVADYPPLQIMAGDSNGLRFEAPDGTEVKFVCGASRDLSEATYSISAHHSGLPVAANSTTVRLP